MALTTLARVKALHGSFASTSQDALLTVLIGQVEAMISKYLGMDFTQGTKTEYHNVNEGQRRFLLRTIPIASVTSVATAQRGAYANPSIIPAADYFLRTDAGVLVIRDTIDLFTEPDGLRVIYVGGLADGWQDVTANSKYLGLDFACGTQVLAEYTRRPDWGAVSKSVASGSKTHTVEDDARNTPLLPKVMNILDQYRRW